MAKGARLAQASAGTRLDGEPGERIRLWGQFVGGKATDDGAAGGADADRETIGGFGGVETPLGENGLIGLGGGYTRAKIDDRRPRQLGPGEDGPSVRLCRRQHRQHPPARRGRGTAGTRWRPPARFAFPGLSGAASASYNGETLHGFVEAGYSLKVGESRDDRALCRAGRRADPH